jgi:TolB protein
LVSSDGADANPAFAPVGDQLAFTSTRDGVIRVYLASSDGADQRALTTEGSAEELDPRWSPDGSRLAFVAVEGGSLVLVVVNADGSGARTVTPAGFQGQVSWSG